jgi:hypothetical protein
MSRSEGRGTSQGSKSSNRAKLEVRLPEPMGLKKPHSADNGAGSWKPESRQAARFAFFSLGPWRGWLHVNGCCLQNYRTLFV